MTEKKGKFYWLHLVKETKEILLESHVKQGSSLYRFNEKDEMETIGRMHYIGRVTTTLSEEELVTEAKRLLKEKFPDYYDKLPINEGDKE